MKNVSVILPTLNEVGNIELLVYRINKALNPAEIIVIDDGSTDGTIEKIKKLSKIYRNLHLRTNNPPLGLAQSIDCGIRLAKTDIVCWMDADLSHPPEILTSMYQIIKTHDAVIGSWLGQQGKDLRNSKATIMRSLIINTLCQWIFGNFVTAYTSGFAMARKKLFDGYRLKGDYGEYFIDLVVYANSHGKKIVEVPFICLPRHSGISKTNPTMYLYLKRALRYIGAIVIAYKDYRM